MSTRTARQITITLLPEEKDAIQAAARAERLPVSRYIVRVLARKLGWMKGGEAA